MMYGIKSRSKGGDCETCAFADIADEPRTIKKGNTTIYQSTGSINCTCESIHNLSISDDGIVCSEYKERSS